MFSLRPPATTGLHTFRNHTSTQYNTSTTENNMNGDKMKRIRRLLFFQRQPRYPETAASLQKQQQHSISPGRAKSPTNISSQRIPEEARKRGINHMQPPKKQIPSIPAVIWVVHVMPYLDRISQNRLGMANKDIYETSKQYGMDATSWPHGNFSFKKAVVSFAFSPNGLTLAIVLESSRSILIWDRKHGYTQKIKGEDGIITHVAFCPVNNGLLACCTRDGTIVFWKQQTTEQPMSGYSSQQLLQQQQQQQHIQSQNKHMETNTTTAHYTCIRRLSIGVLGSRFIKFSPCGHYMATWGNDRMIRVDTLDNQLRHSFVGTTPWRSRIGIRCYDTVVFPNPAATRTPLANVMVYTFNNETVRIWNPETLSTVELRDHDRTGRTTLTLSESEPYITSIQLMVVPPTPSTSDIDNTGEQNILVVGCRVGTVKFWDLKSYTCIRSFQLGGGNPWMVVNHIVISPDGTKMACTGGGTHIRLFDVDKECYLATLDNHKEIVQSLAISPDGLSLASGGSDRTLRLWNLRECCNPQPECYPISRV